MNEETCDFCHARSADFKRIYSCQPFSPGRGLIKPTGASGAVGVGNHVPDKTEWAACGECAPFIDKGDYDGLMKNLNRRAGVIVDMEDRRNVKNNLRQFFANRINKP